MVYFGDIITDDYLTKMSKLTVALGKNIDGEPIYKSIEDMPHCLVGGATKSGKSVCINTILISLLIKNKPDELKLLLIDPKTVELGFYEGLPHLVTPVVTDTKIASQCLKWLVDEMERRYRVLSQTRVRNIQDYIKKQRQEPTLNLPKMPYIVLVIDEFADLMMTCQADVEDSIQRITQKARAAGIHLIIATQRPVVEFVKGSIKANIPTKIAFKVSSAIDSNIILDEAGAETLLGKGDMLLKGNDIPERLQGAYISDDEINAVCDYIRSESGPDYIFTHEDLEKNIYDTNLVVKQQENQESDDVLYNVGLYCIQNGTCSINSIQQQFNFGFNRAKQIVQTLEDKKIVSEKRGTQGREILITIAELNELFERED